MLGRPKRKVSLYVALGLTKNATESDIHEAYKKLHEYYLRAVEGKKKGSRKKLRDLEKAYRVLSDADSRAFYDEHGTTGRWAKVKAIFSPENIDKQSQSIKNLWTCCFAATCCCFCYCCCQCCNSCCQGNNVGIDDDEELYIQETFAEYLMTDKPSMFACGRRRKKEVRQAARRRRKDIYRKKDDLARQDGAGKSKNDTSKSRSMKSIRRKSTKRSSRCDSGCESGFENGAFDEDDEDEEEEEEGEVRVAEFADRERKLDSGRCSAEINPVDVDNVLRTISERVQIVRPDHIRRGGANGLHSIDDEHDEGCESSNQSSHSASFDDGGECVIDVHCDRSPRMDSHKNPTPAAFSVAIERLSYSQQACSPDSAGCDNSDAQDVIQEPVSRDTGARDDKQEPVSPDTGARHIIPEPVSPDTGALDVIPESVSPDSGARDVNPEPVSPDTGARDVIPEPVSPEADATHNVLDKDDIVQYSSIVELVDEESSIHDE